MLTTLGIVIAVAAVVSTVGAVTGLKQFVLKEFESVGAKQSWNFPRMPQNQRERLNFRQLRVKANEVDAIEQQAPSPACLTPVMQMILNGADRDTVRQAVLVQGIRPSWTTLNRSATKGRPFNPIDCEDEGRSVCLINDKGVEEMGMANDPRPRLSYSLEADDS